MKTKITHRKNLSRRAGSILACLLLTLMLNSPGYSQYCTPNAGSFGCDDGDEVHSFILVGENATGINDPNSGCSGPSAYDDQTSLPPVSLLPSNSYTATISSEYFADYCAIWIDFNDDQVFNNSERVVTFSQSVSTSGSSVVIPIPATAPSGLHRMRVMVAYPYDQNFNPILASDFDPCNTGANAWEYGEVHDYMVDVLPPPACIPPAGLTVANITSGSADISWTGSPSAPANGYEYYYSINSTTPTAATVASGTSATTSATINMLNPNTTYYVWVRAVCSSGESNWGQEQVFTTLCTTDIIPYTAPLATVYTPELPDCMGAELINLLGTPWHTEYYPGSGFTENTLVSNYTYSGDGAVDSWVFTNGLALTGGTIYQLHYRYGNNSIYYSENLAVKYGTSPSASEMIFPLEDHLQFNDATPHDTIVYFVPPVTGTYYIGFHAHSDEDQYNIYLDNISVDFAPPCNAPSGLVAANAGSTVVDLSWNGTADQYTIEYGSSGFLAGSGTSVSTTGSNYQLTGLAPNTGYDFYVRSVCIPGMDTSAYSAVGSFTTVCPPLSISLGNDTAICAGMSLVLNAGNPGSTYLWSDGSGNQSMVVEEEGTYTVTITDIYGCTETDNISVIIHPRPVVDLGPDITLCEGTSVVLDAGNPGNTFLWNTTDNTQSLTVNSGGLYSVWVTDTLNCKGGDTIQVIENAFPVAYGITALQNPNGSFDFSAAGAENVQFYLWDFGDGTETTTEEQPNHHYAFSGYYEIRLVISNDCGTDTIDAILHYNGTGMGSIALEQDQLKLFPNPARDRINIRNTGKSLQSLTVYNILGKVVFREDVKNPQQHQLDLREYAPGIYNLQIRMSEGYIMRKFEVIR